MSGQPIPEGVFEPVYTESEWYDGPRRGIAEFGGKPHLYECEWDETRNNYAETFLLSPVEPETVAFELEAWAISGRWEQAHRDGLVDATTCPALPHERARYEELQGLLATRLVLDPTRSVRRCAEFRPAALPSPGRYYEVRWCEPPGSGSR